MTIDPSKHAGDRSFERNIDYKLATHVIRTGSQTVQENGNILHEARDPNNIDHVIKVVTTPHPKKIVTVIRDTSRPFKDVVIAGQASASRKHEDEYAKPARTKKNKKDQKMKKWKRNPPKDKS